MYKHASLLNLPGEIRNAIYNHALTAPSAGLNIVLPCTRTTSPPRLAAGHGIQRPVLVQSCDKEENEYNQLKFVCKQLYREAAGLEVKLNNLVVEHKSDSEATCGEQMLSFMAHVQGKVYWLTGRTITIKTIETEDVNHHEYPEVRGYTNPAVDMFPDTAANIFKIAAWCQQNPSVKIKAILPGLKIAPRTPLRYFFSGMALKWMLRGETVGSSPIIYRRFPPIMELAAQLKNKWFGNEDINSMQAENLRFYAICDMDGFDWAKFDRILDEQLARALPDIPKFWIEFMQKWPLIIRSWVEDGF
ncbi:hypothetical protein NX059_004709 [Plenodomus lindquistii]|nr:hypothetical protein NX059_004709 [Plenodomus lindquistii]